MATTRLIPMHKIKNQSIAYTVHKRINDAINSAKTLGGELVMTWTKGKHRFVVATHIDHAHIHTHIMQDVCDCLPDNIPADHHIADEKDRHLRQFREVEQAACKIFLSIDEKHRLPCGSRCPAFHYAITGHIRLDLLNQRLCFGQNSVKLIVRRIQNHLLTQEVDGYAGHTINLLYGVLDFVSTMAAVQVKQFNGLFHVRVNLETVCLLSNRKLKSDTYIKLSLDMEDYYRIKDAEKEKK